MPPYLALLAQAASLELGVQRAVEDHARQRIAWPSRNEIGARGPGPDLEEFFGGHLVSDMPVGNSRLGGRRQDVVAHVDIFLKLHSTPVLGELGPAALNGERRVRVLAIRSEKSCEHGFVSLLPRCPVALHELMDVHVVPVLPPSRQIGARLWTRTELGVRRAVHGGDGGSPMRLWRRYVAVSYT